MEEHNHDVPSADQLLDTPNVTLSITPVNGFNDSFDSDTLAIEVPREEDQINDLVSPIKKEDQLEVHVDETPKDQDDSHQASLPAESEHVFSHLQKVMNSTDADVLSHHQRTGERILEELTKILSSDTKSIDISRISSIKKLLEGAKTPQTILGVVGGTGHGKSSLINALLGEDKLVPTNCFRACTAVVTEISFNFSDNPDHRYTAEVEFISVEDWDRELEYLFHDLSASSGEVSNHGQLEDDAGIAWAKIKAVYPKLTKQMLGQTNAKALAADPAVKSLLGTTTVVRKPTAKELYEGIQRYVDSKKKMSFATLDNEENNSERKLELWPLIKVVRIYTKADVLSSGAVIVDLPGVKDSNAARAAVAGKYIEKCNGLWVVSMITRAVDDQAAQELLGASFKQQLRFDGNYSNVTFVCSKTDDINIREAAEGLGLTENVKKLSSAKYKLDNWEKNSELENLKKRKEAISTYADEVDKHIDRYEKLRAQKAKGKMVTPPKERPGKRRAGVQLKRANKRRRVGLDEGPQETRLISTEDHWEDLENGLPKFSVDHQLTEEDIQSMTEYLRSRKAKAIDEKESIDQKIDDDENRLEGLQDEVADLEEQLNLACVSRRNDCSRGAIRDQFALGLKELDQQEAHSQDPTNFDPDKEFRDYAGIGHSLPVFCISSLAYQALANDEQVAGFRSINDTGIPQLRAHTKQLTEATRITKAKLFLNDLAQTLNSLYLWSSKKSIGFYLTDEEKNAEMGYVKERVNELEKRLLMANENLVRQLNDILEALFRYFDGAALHASSCAPEIAHRWASHKRGDGGLHFASYRATLRRNGVFSGKGGPRNFNEDLAAPLLQKLGKDWEITFTKKIPEAVDQHAKTCQVHQEYIQGLIKSRLDERAVFNDIIGMLQDQDKARINGLTNKIKLLISDITASQRDANRDFTPAIQKKLTPKYKHCAMDKGPGVFARMKLEMEGEIKKHRRSILNVSCKSAKAKLSEIPTNIQEDLRVLVGIMRNEMISDYNNVILGADNSEESKLVRQKTFELLKEVDGRF
ncbi:hypothetical protein F4859DRAFT_512731 [Xylaria cf. heliscus]|nr:hypothetical protein F4859DRAFT_512731 [Xylaria cf. heliscus]